MVDKLNNENDFVFQKAIKALRQTKYEYPENDNEEETMKQLYADKLKSILCSATFNRKLSKNRTWEFFRRTFNEMDLGI